MFATTQPTSSPPAAIGTSSTRTVAPDFDEADVQQVALGGWRVTDRLVDPLDQCHLLGYIELRGDRYETMHIGIEFEWVTFDTMAQAIHHLLTTGRAAALARGSGDMSWLAALPKSSLEGL